VFELDEAYARQFTDVIRPDWVLGLNASRDQLDRFGEVDVVARLIAQTMLSATKGIIVNADDTRLCKAVAGAKTPVVYFGVASALLKYFPRDDELVAVAGSSRLPEKLQLVAQSVTLESFKGDTAVYMLDGKKLSAKLRVTGQHNFQNAAGALALVHALLPDVSVRVLAEQLAHVRPAFGRGQVFRLKNGTELQLNLVKNPASFRQGLASYVRPEVKIMIAINDNVADSRDMSWLWDIDFSDLQKTGVAMTSGSRAADMALRLHYDELRVNTIEPSLDKALAQFAALPGDKVIFASYTAMLRLYHLLSRKAGKEL
jgi:UDP-N-acetylmuramyl tripeptide synthase